MPRMVWTDEEIDVLKKLTTAGVSPEGIEKVLIGRTVPAIRGKISTMGLTVSPPDISTLIDQDKLKEMLNDL